MSNNFLNDEDDAAEIAEYADAVRTAHAAHRTLS